MVAIDHVVLQDGREQCSGIRDRHGQTLVPSIRKEGLQQCHTSSVADPE